MVNGIDGWDLLWDCLSLYISSLSVLLYYFFRNFRDKG